MTQIFAIQDNQGNFFKKVFKNSQINIPQFGNDGDVKIFNSSNDAQKVADTLTVPVTVTQVIKKS